MSGVFAILRRFQHLVGALALSVLCFCEGRWSANVGFEPGRLCCPSPHTMPIVMMPNNINATTMKSIKVPVPTLSEQRKFVARIEALEQQVSEAQAVIDGAASRKQAILDRYL